MSLSSEISPSGVRSAFRRLPTDLFTIYDQIIDRIRNQPTKHTELGLGVLSTIFGATRPLGVAELGHALAIRRGNSDLDFGEVVGLETIFSSTAGLVTTYIEDGEDEDSIKLVHYTLQEYFELNQWRHFPELGLDMARKCLSYLSLNESGSGKCANWQLTERRMEKFHFLHYAAHNWAHHLRGLQRELMHQNLAFAQDEMKTSAWLDYFRCNKWLDIGLSTEDLPLDPAFLAAHFHLLELFTWLILSRDINITNQRGEKPLLRAVKVEPWQKCLDLPCLDFLDETTWQGGVEPWFVRSLDTDQHNMIQVIP